MDPLLGQIVLFAGNYAPQGWMFCNGQLLSVQQYTALFSLLGTVYGGDGKNTFGLPDLRGRVPVGAGQLQVSGGGNYVQGQTFGSETVTLLASQMPAHNHVVEAVTNAAGNSSDASNNFLAANPVYGSDPVNTYYSPNGSPLPGVAPLNPAAVGVAGSSQAHENRQPSLVMNYIIAVLGVWPARN